MLVALACVAALAAEGVDAGLPVRSEWVAGGVTAAVDLVAAGDGAAGLFVVEQRGRIRILREGVLLATPFLDIGALVSSSGERGLLGLAFHPQYAANGRFFVNYTRAGDGATVLRPIARAPTAIAQIMHRAAYC